MITTDTNANVNPALCGALSERAAGGRRTPVRRRRRNRRSGDRLPPGIRYFISTFTLKNRHPAASRSLSSVTSVHSSAGSNDFLSGFGNFVPKFRFENLARNRFFLLLVPNINLTLLARNARIFVVARLERVLECFSVAKRNWKRFGDFLTNGRRLSSHVAAGDESENRRLSANSPDETGRNSSSSRGSLQERARPTPTKSGISASGYALKHGALGSFPIPGRKRFASWANGLTTAAIPLSCLTKFRGWGDSAPTSPDS